MLNILSIVLGCFALMLSIPAFIPLLGWANWLILPFALVGLVFGVLSDRNAGRNINLVVLVVGIARLWLGGGII
jgi:hypothetical protein